MAEGRDPGTFLRGGEFYSPVEARLRTDDVVLSALRQPCSRTIPRHQHELAYITVVLGGNYREGDHGKLDDLLPFTASFNPTGVQHASVIGPAGVSFFTIELRDGLLRQLDLSLPQQKALDRGAGAMLWP